MSNKPYRSLAMITLGLLVVFALLQAGYLAAGYNDLQGDEPLPPAAWTCWNVGTADPCQQDIRAVAMLSTTDGWAVGQNGLAMRWNGLNWTAHDTPTQGWLNDVTAVAPDNVWAVGGLTTDDPFEPETIIIHWNGNTWQEWPVPPDAIEGHLTVIAMHSANYGLAAGSSGVLEWNGSNWQKVAPGFSFYSGVSLTSPTNGWFVSLTGTLTHWDGESLTHHTGPSPGVALFDVQMVSADDGWAVGGTDNNSPPVFLRWDGESWHHVPLPPGSRGGFARAVSMLSGDEGWAIADTNVWRWDGETWSTFGSLSGMVDIDMVSSESGWSVGLSGRASRWDGSVWQPVPAPAQHPLLPLLAVDLISATEGWAVGSKIHRWNGSTWQEVNKPESGFLRDVKMLGSNEGWAVGEGGSILRWNGSEWTAVASPVSTSLLRVDFAHSDHGWAVGEGGVILGWDGSEWTTYASPTSLWINSVASIAPNDAWAVGYNGVLLRWDGNSWTQTTSNWNLADIHMLDANTGWAVGPVVDSALVVYWDGVEWTEQTASAPFDLYAVTMNSATDGWAMGHNGQIVRWDGVAWQLAPSPTTHYIGNLALAGNTGFAVGPNVLLTWDGSAWQSVTPPTLPSIYTTYRGIDAVSPTNIWAVGQTSSFFTKIIHWNGQRWAEQFVPSRFQLNDIAMLTETDGWAVGVSGLILKWDGLMWHLVESPVQGAWLYGVDMLATDDVWMVGDSGRIFHWDGDTVHIVPSGTTTRLNDVHMLSSDNGWIVGGNGLILQWDGDTWEEVASLAGDSLNGVHLIDSETGWAVGSRSLHDFSVGLILHWDGEEWAEWPLPDGLPPLTDVHFSTADNGWAVGQSGVLLHWDGTTWSQTPQPTQFTSHAVTALDTGEAWAVGVGPILRYRQPPVLNNKNYLPVIVKPE
jgi:hypothetical protein